MIFGGSLLGWALVVFLVQAVAGALNGQQTWFLVLTAILVAGRVSVAMERRP